MSTTSVGPPAAVPLPKPTIRAGATLERALATRRARRTFADQPVALGQLAQLLWAAQGVTGDYDLRTAPSAGALHPLRLYVIAARVDGLAPGVYRYRAATHDLEPVAAGDFRAEVTAATSSQECLGEGALDLVIAADPRPTTAKYGDRGLRYLYMEAGHASQNVYLQATALGLATTSVGAFDDAAMARVAHLRSDEIPVYAMPVGHPGR